MNSNNKYTQIQLNEYNRLFSLWSEQDRDLLVDSFDKHNIWVNNEFFLKNEKSN
jgi:hypothetical protein